MITQTLAAPRIPQALQMPSRVSAPQLGALDSFTRSSNGKSLAMGTGIGAVGGALALGLTTASLTGTAASVMGAVSGGLVAGGVGAIAVGITAIKIWGHHDLGDLGIGMAGAILGGVAGAVGGAVGGAFLGVGAGNVLGFAAGAIGGAFLGYNFTKGATSH